MPPAADSNTTRCHANPPPPPLKDRPQCPCSPTVISSQQRHTHTVNSRGGGAETRPVKCTRSSSALECLGNGPRHPHVIKAGLCSLTATSVLPYQPYPDNGVGLATPPLPHRGGNSRAMLQDESLASRTLHCPAPLPPGPKAPRSVPPPFVPKQQTRFSRALGTKFGFDHSKRCT